MATQLSSLPRWVPRTLAVLGVTLGVGLLYLQSTVITERNHNVARIVHFSNEWVRISEKLNEQKLVNQSLEADQAKQAEELKEQSQRLAALTSSLKESQAAAQAASQHAQQQLQKQATHLDVLSAERTELSEQIAEMSKSMDNLVAKIADTERKLNSSSADREQLQAELTRLRAEKAELESRFQSLASLQEQIRKLRAELALGKRLAWIRRGIYGTPKGAELLRQNMAKASPPASYNLDVEVRRDGSATVVAPGATSAPNAP